MGPLLHLVNRVVNKDSKSFFEFLYLFMVSLIIREIFFFASNFVVCSKFIKVIKFLKFASPIIELKKIC